LREARSLDPAHPAYAEEIGRLYHGRALQLPPGEALAQDYARQGLEYHRDAIRLRPGHAYSWANVALLKARLPEPDAEFESALGNAALLGPWEPDVQLAVVEAGFVHWNRLSPQMRAAARDMAARAIISQDANVFALARRTGRLGVLCGLPEVARSALARSCI
jgi:cytochrome c-type biogenesis protein CcmH/NrfG